MLFRSLAAEPHAGGRVYLCAFRNGEAVSWLALDEAGKPVTARERLREAATLVALRLTEDPPGLDEAEEAVLHLQQILGGTPRLATPSYLDDVGAAARRLEEALGGPGSSPFAEAMKASAGAVQAFSADVEGNYKAQLD